MTRPCGSIKANQLSETEAASASSLNVSAVSKKIIIFRRRKLTLVFRGNLLSLNELVGYLDLTVFHEIWSEYSLIDVEQNCVGECHYLKYFPHGGLFFNSPT